MEVTTRTFQSRLLLTPKPLLNRIILGALARQQAIVISQEEEAQIDRITYLLAHEVKEGLVARVLDWPGAHAAAALLSGLSLEGTWYDRTKE